MTDLIARLEAAEEGSRDLSDEVLLACGWATRQIGRMAITGGGGMLQTAFVGPDGELLTDDRPCPTTSLDAALSLVPSGWACDRLVWLPRSPRVCTFRIESPVALFELGRGRTPELAVCAAILRAREAEKE